MARKEIIRYIDDIDGSTLDDDQRKVVRFGFNNQDYVLDLSPANAAKFEEVLKPYVEAATPVDPQPKQRRGSKSNNATRTRNRIIRQWAKNNGFDVADRGALSKSIIEKYEASHRS
ncbi:Lsr2 family protein [Corynebacterium sp. TAE3-ERU12]|uniref:histone-like nucleoid-structuring protein Lsr2 n=1 Tax=Corynebacterium sp. TAE3-ERU12 TaxID=2849491 RepID=UPI001C467DBF|nr:Lsr2 family protein [Corynebacterium sp. TAE3-ERU12]MBV7296099.1 Lsr2 family protein [Corynebacterium sp. TAE3-ERU12]